MPPTQARFWPIWAIFGPFLNLGRLCTRFARAQVRFKILRVCSQGLRTWFYLFNLSTIIWKFWVSPMASDINEKVHPFTLDSGFDLKYFQFRIWKHFSWRKWIYSLPTVSANVQSWHCRNKSVLQAAQALNNKGCETVWVVLFIYYLTDFDHTDFTLL